MNSILLVGDFPPPLGGIAVHVRQLRDFLVESGADVQVCDIGKGGAKPGVLRGRPWRKMIGTVGRAFASGALVHLHISGNSATSWAVASAIASLKLAFRGRAVLTVHSGLFPKFLHRSGALLSVRLASRGFDRLVAVSHVVEAGLVRAGVPANRILVAPAFLASQIRPGNPPERFAEVRARHFPLLVAAGHPSAVYGRKVLFEALPKIHAVYPQVGLALFGPGTNNPTLLAEAEEAGISRWLERFGELAHEQTLALIFGSDVFVRPTTTDGDSISVREALTLGVRCVASDAAPRPEQTVLFQTDSSDDLCEAVMRAMATQPPKVGQVDAGPSLLQLYRQLQQSKPASPEAGTRSVHETGTGA